MLVKFISVFIFSLLLSGCNPSADKVAEMVRESVQETLTTNPSYKEYGLNVKSVAVIHESDRRYQGLVTVYLDGAEYKFPVSITADNDSVIWKSEPGAFSFIAQHQINKLQMALKPEFTSKAEYPASFSEMQWSVQVASLSSKEVAGRLLKSLQVAGYNSYISRSDDMNRVFVGPYKGRSNADIARDQIFRQQKLNGFVVRYEPEASGVELLSKP